MFFFISEKSPSLKLSRLQDPLIRVPGLSPHVSSQDYGADRNNTHLMKNEKTAQRRCYVQFFVTF